MLAVAGWLLICAGCGDTGPLTVPVTGEVTLDGQPLADGDIIFESQDPTVSDDAGKVNDGKFSFRAKPGVKKVKIMATREEGPVDPAMGVAPRKQYLPGRYNAQTTLDAEVTDSGDNKFTFPMTSQPDS